MSGMFTITLVLLFAMLIIHDRRISELEQRQEELMRKVERLASRIGRPYG